MYVTCCCFRLTVLPFIYLTFRAFHVFNRSYVNNIVSIYFHCGYKYFIIAEIFLIKTNHCAFYSLAFDTVN